MGFGAFAQEANSQWEKANTLKEQGIYDSAVFWFEKAAETYKQSGNTSKELDAINQAGFLYSLLGNPQKGMELLQPALERGLKIKSGKNEQVAASYHSIGVAYYVAGMYNEAIENTEKGYELRKEIFDGPHEDIAKSLNNLGILYENTGDLNKAFEIYKEAHEMQLQIYGDRHVEVANSLNNLGANAYYRGDYQKALPLYHQALNMYKEFVEEDHKDIASVYLNIGTIHSELGEYQRAMEFSKQAENIYVKLYGKEDPNYLNVALNLSTIFKELAQLDEALAYATEGYELAKMFYGEQHPVMAQLAQNIGVIYDDMGDLEKAIEWQQKSLDVNLATQGESNLNVAYNYNNLGTAHQDLKDYVKAEEYFRKALQIKSEILGPRHVSVSLTWNNIAMANFLQQEFEEAVQAAHFGLMSNHFTFSDSSIYAIPDRSNYSDPESFIQNLILKSGALLMMHETTNNVELLESAAEHVDAGLDLLNKWQLTVGSEDKIQIAEEFHDLASVAVNVYHTMYNDDNNNEHLRKMFEFIERTKGAVLNASIEDANAKQFAGIPKELIAKEDTIKTQIGALKQEIALAQNSGASESDIAPYRSQLFDLRSQYEKLIQTFESDYSAYYELKYNLESVGVDQIQSKYLNTRPNTAVIEYFHSDSTLYSFIITPTDTEIITLANWDYDRNIRGLRNAIIYRVDEKISALSHEIYTRVFAEVDHYLSNNKIEEVVIIPDGILGYLPFEALLTAQPNNNRFDKMKYLLNRYDIKYAASSTIMYKQSQRPPAYGDKDYVAFAPVFTDGTETNFLVNTSERFYNPNLENTRSFVRDGKITPIPSTKTEVEHIHDLHQKKNLFAKYFLFKDAKEENLKDPELGHYKFIHLATHGFVNDEVPELSGLVMSQSQEDSEEDGILYVGEIYNLKWKADMVALSACETGLGKVVKGEGIIGLTRAFMYAGAENVLVSLWKVSDQSTSDLMIDFYNHLLEGNTKAASLREAKLKLIKSKEFANPYYWAPFILIGN